MENEETRLSIKSETDIDAGERGFDGSCRVRVDDRLDRGVGSGEELNIILAVVLSTKREGRRT